MSDQNVDQNEIVDVEEFASAQRPVPRKCRGYRIRVNEKRHVVHESTVSYEDAVELSERDFAEPPCVRVRVRGKKPKVLSPGESVDVTEPGVERFQVGERCVVNVKLNDVTEFKISVPSTGSDVKAAAIAAGSNIKPDFVLYLELEDGQSEQIGDDELIFVDKGACFTALDSDDNS